MLALVKYVKKTKNLLYKGYVSTNSLAQYLSCPHIIFNRQTTSQKFLDGLIVSVQLVVRQLIDGLLTILIKNLKNTKIIKLINIYLSRL